MNRQRTYSTGWFHYQILGEVEEIDVIDRFGNTLPSFVWEELVTTGKQRVHAGFRVVVDIQGSIR